MSNFKRVEFNSIWSATSNAVYQSRWPDDEVICPLCVKRVQPGNPITLFINNHEFFPNCMVHNECIDNHGCLEIALITLRDSWNEAQKHKHWFRK